jgi:hypothetical protein
MLRSTSLQFFLLFISVFPASSLRTPAIGRAATPREQKRSFAHGGEFSVRLTMPVFQIMLVAGRQIRPRPYAIGWIFIQPALTRKILTIQHAAMF